MGDAPPSSPRDDRSEHSNAFADTGIFINYVQQEIERDVTSTLVEGDGIDVVLGVTVIEELEDLRERRDHIYTDFVDFLVEEDGDIGEYCPNERRPYFDENDRTHVYDIQMKLSQMDERAKVQRALRTFVRGARRRFEYVFEEVIPDNRFDQMPGLGLIFALGDVIENDNDRNVVGDAALWSAEGNASSGVFLTLDKKDLLSNADEINDVLEAERDDEWTLRFRLPSEFAADEESSSTAVSE